MGRRQFTAEERRLMNIHKASTPTSFYVTAAAVVSLIPICKLRWHCKPGLLWLTCASVLFCRIMVLDLFSNGILFLVFAAIATVALTFAYQNTARKSKDA
jgi:hypothetical protein